jgi:hypothetical protein
MQKTILSSAQETAGSHSSGNAGLGALEGLWVVGLLVGLLVGALVDGSSPVGRREG